MHQCDMSENILILLNPCYLFKWEYTASITITQTFKCYNIYERHSRHSYNCHHSASLTESGSAEQNSYWTVWYHQTRFFNIQWSFEAYTQNEQFTFPSIRAFNSLAKLFTIKHIVKNIQCNSFTEPWEPCNNNFVL